MSKSIEQQFKVLDEIEHIRKRPGMYVGSIVPHTAVEYVYDQESTKMISKEITYNPGLVKIFSEILDNSIDEHKRNPLKLNTIKVDFESDGTFSIWDNGGIPVVIHKEQGQYVPEVIFSNLRAGSNFNDEDDQALIGTNGVGSTLSNVLSTKFVVETCDGINHFKQVFTDGMRKKSEPKIKSSSNNHTCITMTPDYEYFKCSFDDGNRLKLIKRVIDAAGNNPGIKFYLNGKKLNIKNFEDYVALYTAEYVYDDNTEWKVAVSAAKNGFQQVSFVNSVETYSGGTHIDYVMNQILSKLREYFKKKHKVDVKPADIKNHIQVFISCDINRPRFNSQTKEMMISEPKEYKSGIDISDKFINKILKSEIIESILAWVEAKALQAELAAAKEANKNVNKANPKHVEKFVDATEKDRSKCILALLEGDSAKQGIQAQKPKNVGFFPLRGKPINAYELSIKEILENKEFKNILTITGLQIGVPVTDISQLRFGVIALTSDADLDGFAICGLLCCIFYRFWPELFDMGVIRIFRTAMIKTFVGKKVYEFYSQEEFEDWRAKNTDTKYTYKYYKGLGSSLDSDWKEYLDNINDNMIRVSELSKEDKDMFKLLFSKEKGFSDMRKQWLNLEDVA